jgi:hypothetical protein
MRTQHDQWWREQSAKVAEREPVRTMAGKRIDPQTADVWFEYGQILDPYRDGGPMTDPECYCVGRVWFAADPHDRVAVWWGDLPKATAKALEEKRWRADADGWRQILEIRDGDHETKRT